MTSASNSGNLPRYNKEEFRKMLKVLNQIIEYLGKFEDHFDKKFNFSKLTQLLNIPNSEIDEIINLLLNFQEKFECVFKKYQLQKYRANNQVYLITERKFEPEASNIPTIITITPSHLKLVNDVIYVFKHVKMGQGFDLVKNGSDLLAKLKELRAIHPYLFESGRNGIVYPSKFGLQLGDLVMSFNKSNRKIKELTIENHTIIVESGE